ncbi:hypothetical protein Q1695_010601 [Nippostrongylus brasiliensis]|nr:hypothetical protein Q1695_010601 [Nippostrongylus brasiliensis]
MKSLLPIVGFALALATSDTDDECGYTVVTGPNPSECDNDKWMRPWQIMYGDRGHTAYHYYHNKPMKVFFTKEKITWEEAKTLCEFHCSRIAQLIDELGLNYSYPVWGAVYSEPNKCYQVPVFYQMRPSHSEVACNTTQHGVICIKKPKH